MSRRRSATCCRVSTWSTRATPIPRSSSPAEREYGVTIVGPVAEDPGWQARAGEGFDKGSFAVDWDRQVVTCPAGKESISWLPNTYPKNGMVFEARFSRKDCTPCPLAVAVHAVEAGAADHRAAAP